MRCKRCWKLNPAEVHTCTPYLYYKGITWAAINKDWEIFNIIVDEVKNDSLIFKITSWEQKWKYSFIYFNEIDDSIKFYLE